MNKLINMKIETIDNKIKVLGKFRSDNTLYLINKKSLKYIIKNKKGGGNLDLDETKCQYGIDNEINTREKWLILEKLLQNIDGKDIATILGKINTTKIIIKVQSIENTNKEYNISEKLSKYPGFAEYYCKFNCGDTKEYIKTFTHENILQKSVYTKKGSQIGIILMKYYENGSFEDVLKKLKESSKKKAFVILVCKKLLKILFDIYIDSGFTHRDLFPKNIVLDEKLNPIIIDYELSVFNISNKVNQFWIDLTDFFDNFYIRNYVDVSRLILEYRSYQKDPSLKILNEIYNKLDEIN